MFLDWKHLRSAERPPFRQKRKIKKFLTVRKRCGTINESLEAKPFKRKRTSKDKVVLWKLNNATWIICDSSQMFLKTSIDYEHKQSAISLLSFDLSRFRPKRLLEPIKVLHILWRVWSWLRTNAGGVLNTCKSNETIESLLLKVEWQTGE